MAYGARPVPQNIMSVEFKILDFMTLKQFGISVALLFLCFVLFNFLPSPWSIVIPLFIIVIGGIVIFVPFNGEPFQEFLSSYMEAMISPQRRVWHKKGIVVQTAAEKARFYRYGNDPVPEGDNKFKFVDQNQIQVTPEQNQLDKAEQQFLVKDEDKSYIPPKFNNTQKQPQNNQGTNISPKVVHNATNLNNYHPQKPSMAPQQSINTQSQQTNLMPQNQAASQPPLMPQNQTQLNAPTNTPQVQPTFLKKETNIPQPNQVNQPNENIVPQKPKLNYEEDETAVKNYIFGSIEDSKDQPVKQAAVILKDLGGNNLEVIYTNSAGEFKTNYEYKAGEYILYVNSDSKDFNEVKIVHEPIDPLPITIRPKDYDPTKKPVLEEDELLVSDTNDDGIFEGAYDSNVFNLGQDYLEQSSQSQAQIQPQQTQPLPPAPSTPELTTPNTQTLESVNPKGGNVVHSAYTSQAANMFDQMTGGRFINDYAENEVQATPPTPAPHQPKTQSAPVTNDVDIIEFDEMPNANVPFENNLVTLANTLNGILVGPNGYGLDNCQIRILDQNSQLITSMNSDQTGRFYTYSPLPNGNYIMYISKNNQNLVGFNLVLTGKVIPPKYINFSY